MVILPDYQGIGLGTKFLNFMAEYYTNLGYDFDIKTSAKNLIKSLQNKKEWCFANYGKMRISEKSKLDNRKSVRTECKTASFFYKGKIRKQIKQI